jgi:hypothetical protein
MKKIIFFAIFATMLSASAIAQSCKDFIYMTNGKVVKYNSTNPKGKVVSQMIYSVKSIVGNKAIVNSKVLDDKGKELSSVNAEMICEGNSLKIDMRNIMPSNNAAQFKDMTAKAAVSYLVYPNQLQVGQTLTEGNFHMEMFKSDQKMVDLTFKIVNRKVIGKEQITTTAGTFDCFKINYDAEMKTTSFGIGIPFTMTITEWYAPKLGLYVKSDATNKNGKLMSSTMLESVN